MDFLEEADKRYLEEQGCKAEKIVQNEGQDDWEKKPLAFSNIWCPSHFDVKSILS